MNYQPSTPPLSPPSKGKDRKDREEVNHQPSAFRILLPLLTLARPNQWTKNGLLFAGYIFAGRMKQPPDVALSELILVSIAFIAFCCLSGFVYVLNDLHDVQSDRAHPLKKSRPLASGEVSMRAGWVFAALLLTLAALLSFLIWARAGSVFFLAAVGAYPLWGAAYSLWLKHWVIVDVLAVAAGFVLRVIAGCLAIRVDISPWLILCTLLLALFIALCKRRHELLLMGNQADRVRSVLPEYSPHLLDQMIAATTAATIMAYSLYTFTAPHILLSARSGSDPAKGNESPWLMLTIPYVMYGMFRYLYLAYRRDIAGTPEAMLKDKPLMLNIALWVATILVLGFLSR